MHHALSSFVLARSLDPLKSPWIATKEEEEKCFRIEDGPHRPMCPDPMGNDRAREAKSPSSLGSSNSTTYVPSMCVYVHEMRYYTCVRRTYVSIWGPICVHYTRQLLELASCMHA